MVSPLVSVMVTMVLLKVALMCAMPRVTPLRIFFFGAPGFAAAPAAPFAASLIASRSFQCGSTDVRRPREPLFLFSRPRLRGERVASDAAKWRFDLFAEFLHAL